MRGRFTFLGLAVALVVIGIFVFVGLRYVDQVDESADLEPVKLDLSSPVGITEKPKDNRPPAPHAVLELPVELKEPEDALALVPLDDVTHRTIQNGSWDDPSTWGGQVPLPGARVHISEGVTVAVGDSGTAHLKSLRIDGEVVLTPTEDTQVTVDTLVVNKTGKLIAGTIQNPLPGDVEALISIEPFTNPNDTELMRKHSAQMISMGEVSLHGQSKSGMGLLSQDPLAGDRELVLDGPPVNWKEGDLITIGGSRANRDELEALQIKYVKGNRVGIEPVQATEETWKGLAEDHAASRDLRSFVVNYSRNVAIAAPPSPEVPEAPRASVTFQGNGVGKTSLSNVGLYGLGETGALLVGQDESITRPAISFHQNGQMAVNNPIQAPSQNAASVLSTAPGAKRFNPALDPFCLTPGGTVGLPANRTGQNATGPSAQLTGVAIVDAPENGIQINDSAVTIRGGIAYDEEGGGWLTPNGSPSRLVWTAKRTVPSIVGGGLP